jgi:hypothetical protein
LFAKQYLKDIPKDKLIDILEVGAGDGYFSQVYSKFKDGEKDIVSFSDTRGHEFFIILKK